MPRRCVVSLATDHGRYPEAVARLRASLARTGYDGEVAAWEHGELPRGCSGPRRRAVRVQALRAGRGARPRLRRGALARRRLRRDQVHSSRSSGASRRDGHILFGNRNRRVGEWSADAALDALGVSREEALEMPELNAAAIGLDLRDTTAAEFQGRWLDEARRGTAFRGHESEHRHDQTVAGVLAARLGMRPLRRGLEPLNLGQRHIRVSTRIVVGRDVGQGHSSLAGSIACGASARSSASRNRRRRARPARRRPARAPRRRPRRASPGSAPSSSWPPASRSARRSSRGSV